MSVHLYVCVCVHLRVHMHVRLHLRVCLPVCLPACLPVCLSVCDMDLLFSGSAKLRGQKIMGGKVPADYLVREKGATFHGEGYIL